MANGTRWRCLRRIQELCWWGIPCRLSGRRICRRRSGSGISFGNVSPTRDRFSRAATVRKRSPPGAYVKFHLLSLPVSHVGDNFLNLFPGLQMSGAVEASTNRVNVVAAHVGREKCPTSEDANLLD